MSDETPVGTGSEYDRELAGLRAKKLQAILEADRRVEERSRDLERAKATAKAAREAHAEAISDRESVLHDARKGQLRLDEQPPARATEPGGDDDAWKAVRLDAGGAGWRVKPGHLKALAAAGIETWGEFSAAVERDGDFWHKAIKGLGKSAADSISDAWEAFWAEQKAARERRDAWDDEAVGGDEEMDEALHAGVETAGEAIAASAG